MLKDLSKLKPTKTLKEKRQIQNIPPPELDAYFSRFRQFEVELFERHLFNPILTAGGGGGHIVPALTLTNYNFKTARRIITKSRDFS